ncbi:hypothetical protein CEUSTIGMA_g799.t1 [Chlamydomonas eustigma]|uniref:NAD kinase n=1 Tax=Chlamydomonas eustigma TaxID=1157962 RepID=A0A250WRL8_9CHLO|nr:hypothetical protein CEUSTIGMA_g799.t1 [Chlamydomonas eustigma]|eukprot:GAX73346.1 hypothetical protein CEUSTIGMA_g799.t1 [Chlamydomonas eustigma]
MPSSQSFNRKPAVSFSRINPGYKSYIVSFKHNTARRLLIAQVFNGEPSTSRTSLSSFDSYECALLDSHGYAGGVVRGSRVKYNDPFDLSLRRRALLCWEKGSPSNILLVKKPKNSAASQQMQLISEWLQARGMIPLVEPLVHANEFPQFQALSSDNISSVDLCITLGGDGTVLHLASLFDIDEPLPPVMSFSMGTLGFLTPFDVKKFEPLLERVLAANQNPLYCTLRTRLRCEIRTKGKVQAVHSVLNEVVVDRGAYPGPAVLDVFVDKTYLTTVEADGLIIATPSGSTAYSMSAGGSLIAPSVPCTILTPIAPLSLSFRPIVVPESSSISVQLPDDAKCTTRISFDGRSATRLPKGSSVVVEGTRNPLPMINSLPLDSDWYEGITQKLKWNLSLRRVPRPLGYPPHLSDSLEEC